MKVVLTTPVRKLGYPGDVVDVKRGYAKNYLLPQSLAKRATPQQMALISEQKEEFIKHNAELKTKAIAAKTKLHDKHVNFIVQTAVDGRLFGSVAVRDIAAEVLKQTELEVANAQVLLESPIKATGVYPVVVAIHPEVESTILAVIAKSEAEAGELLAEYRNPKEQEKSPEEQFAEMEAVAALAAAAKEKASKEEVKESSNDSEQGA